jgi:uncharacterized membrane protein
VCRYRKNNVHVQEKHFVRGHERRERHGERRAASDTCAFTWLITRGCINSLSIGFVGACVSSFVTPIIIEVLAVVVVVVVVLA